jgi:bifunctional non-homologous end joining protein LigD
MIHRMDPPLDPERQLMPDDLRPMLPVRGELPPDQDAWGFEVAWGGLRTLLWCEPGHIRKALARGVEDPTMRFPELRRLARTLASTEAVLDGEVVVLDGKGKPRPAALKERKRAGSDSVARRLARQKPATLMLYDVLFLDGHPVLERPYEERRELLERLELEGEAWSTPSYHRGDGGPLLEAARRRGLAGLLAKRLDGPYEPGRRSPGWVKVAA